MRVTSGASPATAPGPAPRAARSPSPRAARGSRGPPRRPAPPGAPVSAPQRGLGPGQRRGALGGRAGPGRHLERQQRHLGGRSPVIAASHRRAGQALQQLRRHRPAAQHRGARQRRAQRQQLAHLGLDRRARRRRLQRQAGDVRPGLVARQVPEEQARLQRPAASHHAVEPEAALQGRRRHPGQHLGAVLAGDRPQVDGQVGEPGVGLRPGLLEGRLHLEIAPPGHAHLAGQEDGQPGRHLVGSLDHRLEPGLGRRAGREREAEHAVQLLGRHQGRAGHPRRRRPHQRQRQPQLGGGPDQVLRGERAGGAARAEPLHHACRAEGEDGREHARPYHARPGCPARWAASPASPRPGRRDGP